MTSLDKQMVVGSSPLMLDLMDRVSRVAPLNKPVLIIGERGTGKERLAERLHFLSRRWDQAFLKVNCATMHDNLLESELFGHEAGAFTGAGRRHLGRFERAEGGTLFLDELATCSLPVQEKLLRVVEYGEFERLGGQQTLQADVRLLAATNGDLPALAHAGRFRADLLDRLAFDVLHIPPLRKRSEDILPLAEHFALAMCIELDWPYFPGFSHKVQQQLLHYHWPGNVRELRNVVERSLYRQEAVQQPLQHLVIDPFQSPWAVSASALVRAPDADLQKAEPPGQLPAQVDQLEQTLLWEALQAENYSQKRAAQRLGLTYHQLRARLRKYNMLPLKRYLRTRTDG